MTMEKLFLFFGIITIDEILGHIITIKFFQCIWVLTRLVICMYKDNNQLQHTKQL